MKLELPNFFLLLVNHWASASPRVETGLFIKGILSPCFYSPIWVFSQNLMIYIMCWLLWKILFYDTATECFLLPVLCLTYFLPSRFSCIKFICSSNDINHLPLKQKDADYF